MYHVVFSSSDECITWCLYHLMNVSRGVCIVPVYKKDGRLSQSSPQYKTKEEDEDH